METFHSRNTYVPPISRPLTNPLFHPHPPLPSTTLPPHPPPSLASPRGGGCPRFSIGLLLNKVRVGEALNKVSKRFMTLSNTTRPPRAAIPRTFWGGGCQGMEANDIDPQISCIIEGAPFPDRGMRSYRAPFCQKSFLVSSF